MRKILGYSLDTVVVVLIVEWQIRGPKPYLGSAIMETHERVKFERGETLEVCDS